MSRTQRDLKALRQQQREEAQRRQRAKDRRNLLLIGAALAVAGIAIFLTAAFLNHQSPGGSGHLAFKAYTGNLPGIQMPDEGTATHIDPSTTWSYKNYPPTSGPHFSAPDGPASWQTDAPMREGTFIHNMEHGGIVIVYDCASGSACTTLKNQLDNYVQNLVPADPQFNEYKMVMTPYARGMTHKVGLLAWHYVEWLDGYDQAAITRFYEAHVDQGPERTA